MDISEKEALFVLNNIKELFSDRIMQMYDYAGSFASALEIDADEYCAAGIMRSPVLRSAWRDFRSDADRYCEKSLKNYKRLSDSGIRIIGAFDQDYPVRLKNIPDRPALLYVKGRLPDDSRPSAAIIGARNCSEYGYSAGRHFARELSARGIQIVSGLASGIDSSAAEGSLEGSGESFGVLGTGINICYPRESYLLYKRMSEGDGGVITEFPPSSPALGFHFVLRNRIISGLADILLVIEAREKSGTSTTVEYALSQGKDVFALPGRINDSLGYGCNRMIKDGAHILTEVSDVLEYFGKSPEAVAFTHKNAASLTGNEARLFEVLGDETMHVEDIAAKAGINVHNAMILLSRLELMGYVTSPSGAYYRRQYE